jgi:alpha/beta superfamily hydrolase
MFNYKKLGIILGIGLILVVILFSLPYLYLSGEREYQAVTIPAKGYQLAGYLSEGIDPAGNWIIFIHGNRKEGQSKELYRIIRQNFPEELSVLAIDMRGFGASANDGMDQAEHIILRLEDIEAATNYLEREYEVNADQIILMGHSLGAAQVMRAAQEHSFLQTVPIGLGNWDGLLESESQIKNYTEKFLNNTGVRVNQAQVSEEGKEFSSAMLFTDCPETPAWLVFASADDGLSPLAPSYQGANQRCQDELRWSVIPFSDHMYGTENKSLPGLLKDFRSRIMISLLSWRLERIVDI